MAKIIKDYSVYLPVNPHRQSRALINGFECFLLMQPGKTKLLTNNNSQLVDVLSENSRPEMVIGNRFLFETFDVHKIALIIMAGIALASHATGTASLQFIKILVDYLMNSLLTVFRHFEG